MSGLLHRLGTVRAVAIRLLACNLLAMSPQLSTLPWFAWVPHVLFPALSASSCILVLLPLASIEYNICQLPVGTHASPPTKLPSSSPDGLPACPARPVRRLKRRGEEDQNEGEGEDEGEDEATAALATCRPKMDGWGSC